MFNSAKKQSVRPMMLAIEGRDPKMLQQAMLNGAEVNTRFQNGGKTPLHCAVDFGFREGVQILLSYGADVDAVTVRGFTALHVAAQNGYFDIIDDLVKGGAKINVSSKDGCTPLHEAAARGQLVAVKKLLELGADPNIKDNRYNLTAANLANENRHETIMELLCSVMTYQQRFIQNIHYILFNWGRVFSQSSAEHVFIQQLIEGILPLENADEVYIKVADALKSPNYVPLKQSLKPVRELIITNMNGYNKFKIEARNKVQESAEIQQMEVSASGYTNKM